MIHRPASQLVSVEVGGLDGLFDKDSCFISPPTKLQASLFAG